MFLLVFGLFLFVGQVVCTWDGQVRRPFSLFFLSLGLIPLVQQVSSLLVHLLVLFVYSFLLVRSKGTWSSISTDYLSGVQIGGIFVCLHFCTRLFLGQASRFVSQSVCILFCLAFNQINGQVR